MIGVFQTNFRPSFNAANPTLVAFSVSAEIRPLVFIKSSAKITARNDRAFTPYTIAGLWLARRNPAIEGPTIIAMLKTVTPKLTALGKSLTGTRVGINA